MEFPSFLTIGMNANSSLYVDIDLHLWVSADINISLFFLCMLQAAITDSVSVYGMSRKVSWAWAEVSDWIDYSCFFNV